MISPSSKSMNAHVASAQPSGQQFLGELVFDLVLYQAAQRAGAQHRVEPLFAQVFLGRGGQLQPDLLVSPVPA